MKYYILFIFALFSTVAFSQTAGTPPIQFASKLQISNVTGSNPYVIEATVDDCLSRFTSNSIAVGDSIYCIEGSDLIIMVVTGTPTVSLGVATFPATDIDTTGIVPGGGQAAIVRPTSNYAFPSYICGLRDDLQQMMDARFKVRLDSAIAAIAGLPPAGIDSSFVRNDSMFLALSDGQEYFSGLNYLPSDWGNVLFVSTNGNNSTAVKGDPNKPWADPQAAVNAAMSNDIVWLFPGTWNFGTTGFTVTNLAKEGVTFYMMPGAKLVNVGTTAQTLFSISSTGSYNISGEGYFELGNNDHLIILSDTSFTSNVSFNANGFLSQGGLSSTYRMCTLYGFGTFIFNLDNYEADSVRMYAIDIANVNLTSNKSIAKININNLKHNHNVYSASNTRGVLGISNTSNTDVILNIGNCVVGNTTQNNTYSFLAFSSLTSIENSNISINIENATFTSKSTSLNNTQYVFFHSYPTNGTNSSFSINLKNCISNMNILYKGSQIGSSVDSLYTIYFNAKILQTRGSSIITNSSSPNTTFTSIECNVNIINKGTSSPVVLGSNDKIYISGRINSLVSPVDILSANPKLQIQNSVLLTDVANAAINSSATINVNVLNTFTNTLTIDPDVTELIQPILRNSNVK